MTPDEIIAGLRLIEHRLASNVTNGKKVILPALDECQIVHEARRLIERLREQLQRKETT